jgi:type IV pilus assembly protein PilC
MATFSYTAQDKSGKSISGSIVAGSREQVMTQLAKQDMRPISVTEETGRKGFSLNMQIGEPKVKLQDRVIFTRQLSTLVSAGVPLTRSLRTLTDQSESKGLKYYLPKITKQVEGGISLGDAMATQPKVFSSIYVNMVRAGEAGGILDDILARLALQQEKDAKIRGRLKSAMTYPTVIMSITLVAFIFLMTNVVPKINRIITDLAGDDYQPPVYTRVLLGISEVMVKHGPLLLLVGGVLSVAAWKFFHSKRGRPIFDTMLIRAPVLGKIITKVALARFARTFSALSAAGVSVLDALKVTAEAIGNTVIEREIMHAASEVKNGKPLSVPLSQSKFFPPILSQMAAVGEETGEIDTILVKVADFYEEEVDRVADSLTSIIEPVMIVILGAIIGVIALSVFGPITSATQAI